MNVKLNSLPNDLRDFVISSDIYDVNENGIVTMDEECVTVDDIREQMDYLRDVNTFE